MRIHGALRPGLQRTAIRGMATQARSTLKVALLPADGIGREVIPVRVLRLPALAISLAIGSCGADMRSLSAVP